MILVAVIRPDTARTSKGQLSVKNLHASIVGADHFRSEQNLLRRHIQRLQKSGALRHPPPHPLTRESNAVPCKDLLLPVQLQMVGPFAHDHLRQQAGSGDALFNRLWRLARSPYCAGARILQTSFFDYRERSGNIFVTFARFLANMTQILRTPGTALFLVGKIAHDALALEMPRQSLAATWFLPRRC